MAPAQTEWPPTSAVRSETTGDAVLLWLGAVTQAPFCCSSSFLLTFSRFHDHTKVVVSFPVYGAIDVTGTQTVELDATGQVEVAFQQTIADKHYSTTTPSSRLFEPDYRKVLVKYLASPLQDDPKLSLGELTTLFAVRFSATDGATPLTFDALYFVSKARYSRLRRDATFAATTTPASSPSPASMPTHKSSAISSALLHSVNFNFLVTLSTGTTRYHTALSS
jgi:hypothetical protein